jgi:hypothetical protein
VLICFGAASVIHGTQTALATTLHRRQMGERRVMALDGVAIGVVCFFWQFGNFFDFLAVVFSTGSPLGPNFRSASNLFNVAQFIRDASLVCFPLLFSYMCLHLSYDIPQRTRRLVAAGGSLRFLLWPWTLAAVAVMAAANMGVTIPLI